MLIMKPYAIEMLTNKQKIIEKIKKINVPYISTGFKSFFNMVLLPSANPFIINLLYHVLFLI